MPLDERENLAPWALSWQFWVAPVGVMAPDHSAAGPKERIETMSVMERNIGGRLKSKDPKPRYAQKAKLSKLMGARVSFRCA